MANIDYKYNSILEEILESGFEYEDPRRKGIFRRQIPFYNFSHNFSDGFPILTTKKVYWKGIVVEALWFLRGDNNIKYLIDNGVNIWNKDAYNFYLKNCKETGQNPVSFDDFIEIIKRESDLREVSINHFTNGYVIGDVGRIYGVQWRYFWKEPNIRLQNGVINLNEGCTDQITTLINEMINNPMSTQHIVSAWNPSELDMMSLPPCHFGFIVSCRPLSPLEIVTTAKEEEKWKQKDQSNFKRYGFYLKWNQRSVDTFLGLPFNIASYALLAKILEEITGIKTLGVIGNLTNVHIYSNHLSSVNEQINREVEKYDPPKLIFSENFEKALKEFENTNNFDIFVNKLKPEDFILENYNHYPPLKADMISRDV